MEGNSTSLGKTFPNKKISQTVPAEPSAFVMGKGKENLKPSSV